MLNEIDITNVVYNVVNRCVKSQISGKVYHKECRPTDSTKEDAEVIFSAADTEQIQNGFVYVNIYTKDISCGNGRKVLNRTRIAQIIPLGNKIVEELNTLPHYQWRLDEASRTIAEPDTAEHFVSFKLRFKYYTL